MSGSETLKRLEQDRENDFYHRRIVEFRQSYAKHTQTQVYTDQQAASNSGSALLPCGAATRLRPSDSRPCPNSRWRSGASARVSRCVGHRIPAVAKISGIWSDSGA